MRYPEIYIESQIFKLCNFFQVKDFDMLPLIKNQKISKFELLFDIAHNSELTLPFYFKRDKELNRLSTIKSG
ncbi:hypothetical protein BpHYR1_021246 [Brachionus plicatilis]|uniref:Uncharacterized protein n=1 Tax=Brachionus plicatilis TaxID=10195 RepID=A0A3M7T529_BRAPC|nr:hypothetical protein BpHYR1_021246 [Brachionus plicatilis]